MKKIVFIFPAMILFMVTSCSSDDSGSGTNPSGEVRIKKMVMQEMVGGEWQDSYRTENTFQSNNIHMSSSLTEKRNTSGQWENFTKSEYVLISSDKASQQNQFNWVNGAWVNSGQISFEYNDSGLLSQTIAQNWSNGQWVNSSRADRTYDSAGNPLQIDQFAWTDNQWELVSKTVSTYEGARLVQVTVSLLSGEDWTEYSRELLHYDESGKLAQREIQIQNQGNWVISTTFDFLEYQNEFAKYQVQTNYFFDGTTQQFRYVYTFENV